MSTDRTSHNPQDDMQDEEIKEEPAVSPEPIVHQIEQ